MMLLRGVQESDLEAIYNLAEHSGIGITTLPKDKKLLKKRIQWACSSFKKNVVRPINEYYLFVLEDKKSGQVIGTSAIEASIGHDCPFYSYKISKQTRICPSLNIRSDYEVLSLVNDNHGNSEICTLFLDPSYRHHHNGLLLSRARFLFMAQFPERFANKVIAELRGVSDELGHSPFWDNVGRHFFHMTFPEADSLTISTDKQFIADLMPRNNIYVQILSSEAQAVIGKPHPSSISAMNILKREGFYYNDYVDIFDAGPTIEANKKHIRTYHQSQLLTLKGVSDEVTGERYLISNGNLNFKATLGSAMINSEHHSCILSKETAELLELMPGDFLRLVLLHSKEPDK